MVKSKKNKNGVDYEKLRKRNEKLRKELVHHVKIHKESISLVEQVSEGKFSMDEARKIFKNVDQMFYQDIVEERSGNDFCGYLLCDKTPSNEKQMYRISCNYNKVFDIEERKKFCSDICFRRSMFVLAQIDSTPLWLRDSSRPEIQFLEDNIGLPGIEVRLEHLAELSDSDENDPEKPSEEVLSEVAEDLKLYLERKKGEEIKSTNIEPKHIDKERKDVQSQVVIEEKFNMKDVMTRFIDSILRVFLSQEALSYLQFSEFNQAEEMDSDDEVDLSKFMPKSERKEKITERKDIPSYEALTDDMARVQIQEFWNPKSTPESNIRGTIVDVRKEQEKILWRKLDRYTKPMATRLSITEDDIKEELSTIISKIGISKDAVCLRPSESKLVFVLLLCLISNISPLILDSMIENAKEIDNDLKEFDVDIELIKFKIRQIISETN